MLHKKGADYAIEELILFGKYRVISVLGIGSNSTVYLAEHLKLKVYRAIKSIPKAAADTPSFSKEDGLLSEATLLKNLCHPGIPLIYDIDEDDDYIYMTEEYIQGESLDTFVLHQENISQELIINFGIQLCEILDYLHHLSPFPILYQDLKPEHIILCGNQLKLIDFGIASFFTSSGSHFQLYGTERYVAPEALDGLPVTPSSDLYSLGKVLAFLAAAAAPASLSRLSRIVARATAASPSERYSSAADLKEALKSVQKKACRSSSHLIRNIAVIGSRPGAGATHFSISLVSTLNKKGILSFYMPATPTDILETMCRANHYMKEREGIYYYEYFRGIPDYGPGVEFPLPMDSCLVKDFGTTPVGPDTLASSDLIFFVLSGSDWDISSAVSLWKQFPARDRTVCVCNHHNRKAAKKFASLLGKKVCCFPSDPDPYRVFAEKEQLISSILKKKGGKKKYLVLTERV